MVRDRISHAAIRARKDQNVPAAVVNSKNVIDLLLHIQNGFQCSKILPSFLVTHPGPFALKIINQTVFFFLSTMQSLQQQLSAPKISSHLRQSV